MCPGLSFGFQNPSFLYFFVTDVWVIQPLKLPGSSLEGRELGRGKVRRVFFARSASCTGERPEL